MRTVGHSAVQSLATEWYPLLLATLVVAAVYDYRTRRIPNWLSFSGWLIAPTIYLYLGGFEGLQASFFGFALVLALTFPLFAFGWMGAGDVKLMASVGAYVGFGMALPVLVGILITGGVFAVIMLAYKHSLLSSITRIKASFGLSLAVKKPVYIGPEEAASKVILPYAIPILVGTILTLFGMNNF
jgi:prepilin peptidase CpaA